MSYDLLVFTTDEPDVPDEAPAPCSIDGPLRAEDEDAPAVVAAVLLEVRWLVEIAIPHSVTKRELKRVEYIARAIADRGRGVVYDPQEDAIVWPRSVKRLRALPRGDDDVGRVELEWLVARRLDSADARALLKILSASVPEALPRRFGVEEPMQGRLDRDGEEAFAQLWDGSAMVFWIGTFPAAEGHATLRRAPTPLWQQELADRAPVVGGRKAPPVDAIGIDFRTDVVDDDRWLAALERLFARVAEHLDPFFAAAYVTPQRDARGVALLGGHWLGIPDEDYWLVRLGEPYRRLVPGEPLRRLARSPIAWDELDANRIAWPRDLVRAGGYADTHAAARVIPELA